ncbi:MAG: hypothetical protein C0622_08695 [Desulfuromonas sp.]|nr:MAG: hypothetical protein C0622_08695 [Desulfuromonas sp.]
MSTVDLSMQDGVALLRLDNGVTNAINGTLIADLSSALAQVRCNANGLVLLGNEKFFSIGLNLPELIDFDRAAMTDFLSRFEQLMCELYTLPLPTACALTGHAVAGGCILALACDYRFAAEGRKLIGLNEATIGLPVPYLPSLILRQLIGDRRASDMLYQGQLLSSREAADIGLVDELLPVAEVEAHAVARTGTQTSLPRAAFAVQKENRADFICSRYAQSNQEKVELLLDCWFEESVQQLLKEAARKF